MFAALTHAPPTTLAFVVGLLTAMYAYLYTKFVLKQTSQDANKVFFKTFVAGLAAGTTIALIMRSNAPLHTVGVADPFFAPGPPVGGSGIAPAF